MNLCVKSCCNSPANSFVRQVARTGPGRRRCARSCPPDRHLRHRPARVRGTPAVLQLSARARPRTVGDRRGAPRGGAEGLQVGDTCVVRPFLNNPESRATQRGRPNCCEELRVLGVHVDGGMGDLFAIPPRFLHPVTGRGPRRARPRRAAQHRLSRGGARGADEAGRCAGDRRGSNRPRRAAVRHPRRRPRHGRGSLATRLDFVESQFLADRSSTAQPSELAAPSASALAMPACSTSAGNVETGSEVPGGRPLRRRVRRDRKRRVDDEILRLRRRAAAASIFVGLTLDPITFVDPEFHRREITLMASRNATRDRLRAACSRRSAPARRGRLRGSPIACRSTRSRTASRRSEATRPSSKRSSTFPEHSGLIARSRGHFCRFRSPLVRIRLTLCRTKRERRFAFLTESARRGSTGTWHRSRDLPHWRDCSLPISSITASTRCSKRADSRARNIARSSAA